MNKKQTKFSGMRFILLLLFAYLIFFPLSAQSNPLGVKRVKISNENPYRKYQYIVVEVLDDDLIHVEVGPGEGPSRDKKIQTTPFVGKHDYRGPMKFEYDSEKNLIKTSKLQIQVDPKWMKVTVHEIRGNLLSYLTELFPDPVKPKEKEYEHRLEIQYSDFQLSQDSFVRNNVYGLGQEFKLNESGKPKGPHGDWVSHKSRVPAKFGNEMVPFDDGKVGNTQIPIMYVITPKNQSFSQNYALFLDNEYKQKWNFNDYPWQVEFNGDQIRYYIMAGNSLADLRKDYMELTGRPPVPPRKMFGLWVSEYGYENWDELKDKLRTLRENNFPVDGFILDLLWFGGIEGNSENTRMGSLTWDLQNFPKPKETIQKLAQDHVGLMLIEEPLIGGALPEYKTLADQNFMPKTPDGEPVFVDDDPSIPGANWWGKGGYIDFTNPFANSYWHKQKRQPLIDIGVLGHWTDLGEPEKYDPKAIYFGGKKHEDVHNLYNFLWSKSIYDGHIQFNVDRRPFILSRSGGPGSQRFGVAMWSGDIEARLSSLATQFNAQMHMWLSGIDYYGSDVGGFWRHDEFANDIHSPKYRELYTQWYANSAWFDVPLRPHTFTPGQKIETAPDRVGYITSNLFNTRQRYELIPYYYSLAHRAYKEGEAVFAPMVYHFQNDRYVRTMGDQKMLGKDILVKQVAGHGIQKTDVYLPKGKWFNYHTNEVIHSQDSVIKGRGKDLWDVPLYHEVNDYEGKVFRLPAFVKEGAILPLMFVWDDSKDAFGNIKNGEKYTRLKLKVYSSTNPSSFTLYEDDGTTINYQSGWIRTTEIKQERNGNLVTVKIDPAQGPDLGDLQERKTRISLVLDPGEQVKESRFYVDEKLIMDDPLEWFQGKGSNVVDAVTKEKIDIRSAQKFEFYLE